MAAPPMPLILDDASVKISTDATTANLKELACVATHVELAADTTVTTVDTMCGSTDYAGVTKWTLTCTFVQSFDVGATEEVLSGAVAHNGPVMFEIMGYKSKPASATNPVWSGLVDPRPYPPINGDAGAASEIQITWGVIGTPLKGITTPTSATQSEPEPVAA